MTRTEQADRPAANNCRTGSANLPTLFLLASVIVSFLAASSAPTPLYARYAKEWGFGPLTTTVVFGVYAIAVLVALLVLGRISDHLGRRPVILAAIAGQVAALILFSVANDVTVLVAARVLQGVSTGAAIGAVGAALLDVDRVRGTLFNAVAPGTGTAFGALGGAVVVAYLPAPARLVYAFLGAVLVVQFAGIALIAEPADQREARPAATLRPEVRLPATLQVPVATAAPVLIAVWALAGYYGSLGPALILHLARSSSVVLGSSGLFTLAAVAVVTILLVQGQPAGRTMVIGVCALAVGSALTTVSIAQGSVPGLFLGTGVAGIGFGSGLQGSFRTVVPRAAPHDRAGVLSLLWIVSYVGLGVPAVVAGVLVAHGGGLAVTAQRYNVAVIVLAALAFSGLLIQRRSGTSSAITISSEVEG